MAETRKEIPGGAGCDDKCGCPSPCPGGATCRCKGVGPTTEGGEEHRTCRCGEHCGCNPCSCPKLSLTPASACKCGPACSCSSCAATATAS